MESETQNAPPVVAVVVVHQPGDWFEETLDALAEQDYPNLRFLFLISDSGGIEPSEIASASDDAVPAGRPPTAVIEAMIKARMPAAFVRSLGANPGFGVAANEVLRLVEGQNGFFLFCHDDIAPEPDTVRSMVEELYRSNAGAVGPKLVQWEDAHVLQTVGLALDRFGEIDNGIDIGEVDQEQHDGVRDVFVLPTACLLVRADLFRELDGFDPGIDLHGEDVDLCWRIHHSGARVVVAPNATVRHRGELELRRPDMNHVAIQSRHRLRAVSTLTGGARLPGRLVELIVLTLVELVVGLFTGRFRQAFSSLRALIGLVPRIPAIIGRRRAIKPLRRVPEREVLGLQQRGSARLTAYLRNRETSTFVGAETSVRRWRQSTSAPVLAWAAVLAAIFFGSRSWFSGGVPAVGEFLRFPESPGDLWSTYANGFDPRGLGQTSANPTGWATLAGLSSITLFRMGLLHTVFIVGLVVVGLVGLWKLATVFPSTRARIGALLVYAASPLVGGAMAIGSLNTLIAYASVPWMIHSMRRAVGVATADPRTAHMDIADGLVDLSWPERLRRTLQVGIVIALATAFTPVLLPIAAAVGLLLTLSTLLALAPWQTALRYFVTTIVGCGVAAMLNLPWITTWTWAGLVGPSPIGDPGRGLGSIASFEIGPVDFAYLVFALYLPVVAAMLLARAWRLTWAVRSGVMVVGFGALAVLGDRGELPFRTPEAGVLLAPVAVGLAVSAAAALAAFDLDVRGGRFGWRQPLGIASSIAVVVGLAPGVFALGAGDWNAPSTTLSSLIGRALPDVRVDVADGTISGEYNVLIVGDPRILPIPGVEYRDGIAFAITDQDDLDITDRWAASSSRSDEVIVDALDQISAGSTLRAGQLLAPLGIRFIILPKIDGVISTTADPLGLPIGLAEALDEQLDIVTFPGGLPTVDFYENSAWIPRFSLLTGDTASASEVAGKELLVRADLANSSPIFPEADQFDATVPEAVEAGVVHLAIPFDDRWALTIDRVEVEPRRAFGSTTAFDVPSGVAIMKYQEDGARGLWVIAQIISWLVVLFAATRVAVPLARRRGALVADETLISLEDDPLDLTDAPVGLDPGLDLSGQILRPDVETVDPDHLDLSIDMGAESGSIGEPIAFFEPLPVETESGVRESAEQASDADSMDGDVPAGGDVGGVPVEPPPVEPPPVEEGDRS